MKLYIKQKVFSWNAHFTVKDADGQDRYTVEGKTFSFGHKLHVYDLAGREVAYIEQQLMTWMPRYHVYVEGRQAADIQRKFSFLHPRYEITGPDWAVEGSFWEHDYEIVSPTRGSVARISKEWMTWGDSYELDIADPADELLALAVVLTIDCVMASNNS